MPPVTTRELLMEERRLFYVACTRARQRLVVTAVAVAPTTRASSRPGSSTSSASTSSSVVGRPARPLSMAGLVAELRRTVADPETSEPLRDAAARRLARLAGETVGQPPARARSADPSTWWGTRAADPLGRSRCATPTSRCRSRPACWSR